ITTCRTCHCLLEQEEDKCPRGPKCHWRRPPCSDWEAPSHAACPFSTATSFSSIGLLGFPGRQLLNPPLSKGCARNQSLDLPVFRARLPSLSVPACTTRATGFANKLRKRDSRKV